MTAAPAPVPSAVTAVVVEGFEEFRERCGQRHGLVGRLAASLGDDDQRLAGGEDRVQQHLAVVERDGGVADTRVDARAGRRRGAVPSGGSSPRPSRGARRPGAAPAAATRALRRPGSRCRRRRGPASWRTPARWRGRRRGARRGCRRPPRRARRDGRVLPTRRPAATPESKGSWTREARPARQRSAQSARVAGRPQFCDQPGQSPDEFGEAADQFDIGGLDVVESAARCRRRSGRSRRG